MKIDILYIDSQQQFAHNLLSFLIDKGYNVKYISNIKDAIIEYSFHKPDIIITDISENNIENFNFIKKIQNPNSDIKIIILTDNATQEMFLRAIELKVDKFLFKSQSFEKIEEELNCIKLNRIDKPDLENESLLFDLGCNYIYESDTHRIIKNNNIIQLTSQENSLIRELVNTSGEIVHYKQLQKSIGKTKEASLDTLRTVIRKIKRKTYKEIIENQSGLGYKINLIKDINIKTNFKIADEINIDAKVMVLKGNKKINELLCYYLSKFGFTCESAYTIAQANDLLDLEHYDYIISELNPPDGDCIDFVRNLKNSQNTGVIILSDSSDIHYKEYLYFKGILDYVVDIDDLKYLSYTIFKTIEKVENNTRFNNILVVEKSKKICEQIKDLLLPRKYNIDILNNLTQAYDLLKTQNYNLIIIDIEFSSCFEFISDVKLNIDKTIPFITLSDTNRTYATVRNAFKSGASECLRKPIFAEEFILKVDQLVETSKLICEIKEQQDILNSYKTIVDQSTIVSKTNPEGIITYVNKMFCDISQYDRKELIGKSHNIIRHPDTPNKLFEDMWKTIKHDKKIWSGIVKNKKKNNDHYIVQTYIMPILDYDNNVVEFISLRTDISNLAENKEG